MLPVDDVPDPLDDPPLGLPLLLVKLVPNEEEEEEEEEVFPVPPAVYFFHQDILT